jgi:hypothetical protein
MEPSNLLGIAHQAGAFMVLDPPRSDVKDQERPIECHHALEVVLADIVDQAQLARWRQPECVDAVEALIASSSSIREDPDPADDPLHVEEGLTGSP